MGSTFNIYAGVILAGKCLLADHDKYDTNKSLPVPSEWLLAAIPNHN